MHLLLVARKAHQRSQAYSNLSVAIKRLFVLLLVFTFWGCTFKHTAYQTSQGLKNLGLVTSHEVERTQQWVLPTDAKVYLSYPNVGRQIGSELPRLRTQITDVWLQNIDLQFQNVVMAGLDEPVTQSLTNAQQQGYDLMLSLTVLEAQEHLSSWSEINAEYGIATKHPKKAARDKLYIAVGIYDVRTGKRLDTVTVTSKSSRLAIGERVLADLVNGALAAVNSRFYRAPVAAMY